MEERRDLITERPEPASARPGPGSAEPDEPRHSLRSDVVGAVGLTVVVGLWLIVSPLALGYEEGDAEWVPLAAGALIAGAALLRVTGVRWIGLSFLTMGVAALLFASAFWLADSEVARWNAWACAAIAFFLAAVGASATAVARDTGGRGVSY